jgi:LAO/AO transport system kinase
MMPALMAPSELAQRVLAGDRSALARAITLAQDGGEAGRELIRDLYPRTGRARIVGVTGPPGAGKSTLIGALIACRRAAGATVGVLSVDPTSPFTGGAVLGDRIRLVEHFLDSGVFIRSMASRGALGGLASAALGALLLMDAAGFDAIYLETVGVGQAEIDVVDHVDGVLLVLAPGSGDSVQALKAGVMEIPDVIAINKADHPLAQTTLREVRGVLALAPPGNPQIPALLTDAVSGAGVAELDASLEAHLAGLVEEGALAARRRRNLRNEVIAHATARWRAQLEERLDGDAGFEVLLDEVATRRLDPLSAAEQISAGRDGA